MKVLHCIPNLAGGGAERQLCLLARGLAERGVEVHIAFVPGGENDGLVDDRRLNIHPIRARSSYDPRIYLQLCSIVRRIKPDIVQTWLPQMDFLGGMAARLMARPFVLSERSSAGAYLPSFRTWARAFAGRFATAIVANSRAGLAVWSRANRSPLSQVIHNGVPDEEPVLPHISEFRNSMLESCEELILFVGRYHTDKNVLLTADAVIDVLKQRPAAKALLLGRGPLESQLNAKVRTAGLPDRMFIGPFASNTRFWMAKATVFVSVSFFEGNPNAVIEAARAGVPLVLSDIASHREIFDGAEVVYTDQAAATSVSSAIISVLDGRSEARRRAERSKQKAAQYDVATMVSAYISFYQQICDRSGFEADRA